MARLRQEFGGAGKSEEFDRLKVCLTADRGEISYAEIAAALGMSEGDRPRGGASAAQALSRDLQGRDRAYGVQP